jgi:hypothetical protein
LFASVPLAALATWFYALFAAGPALGAVLLGIAWMAQSTVDLHASSQRLAAGGYDQRGFGLSRDELRLVGRAYLSAVRTANRRFTTKSPALFASLCVVEVALGLEGLGHETIRAVKDADLSWLMVSVVLASFVQGLLAVQSQWFERRSWRRYEGAR